MIEIKKAQAGDRDALADIFLGHISANPEYISHGEIQMGVGVGEFRDGRLCARPSDNAREMWLKYIDAHISDEDSALVLKGVKEGRIVGFCVADIEEDGADPFGMVCDVLVTEASRGAGLGGTLLARAIEWLRSKGIKDIYLESGLNNHSAHSFFEKRGFHHISQIFKLED